MNIVCRLSSRLVCVKRNPTLFKPLDFEARLYAVSSWLLALAPMSERGSYYVFIPLLTKEGLGEVDVTVLLTLVNSSLEKRTIFSFVPLHTKEDQLTE